MLQSERDALLDCFVQATEQMKTCQKMAGDHRLPQGIREEMKHLGAEMQSVCMGVAQDLGMDIRLATHLGREC